MSSPVEQAVTQAVVARAAEEAFAATIGALASRAQREVLSAGREKVQRSAPLWRRVTDGKPCGFCAMVASRGPVYGSAKSAGDGNRYHDHCGCTVEPFHGDPREWEPTPDEQRFIDAYYQSYEPGMDTAALSRAIEERLADTADALADVAELIDWSSAKTPAEVGEMLQQFLGERGTVSGFDHPTLSVDKVRSSAETFGQLMAEFPEVNCNFTIEEMKPKYLGLAKRRVGDPPLREETYTMALNRTKLTARSKTDDMYKRSVETGFWSVRDGTTSDAMTYLVTHEFGHVLDYTTGNYAMARTGSSQLAAGVDAIRPGAIAMDVAKSRGLVQPARHFMYASPKADPVKVKEYHEWVEFMGTQQSKYGQTNNAEGIAEAFADVRINEDRASETSKIAVERLIALLRKKG